MAYELYDRYNSLEGGLNNLSGAVDVTRVFLVKIHAFNNSGDDRYFQLFDTGSLPVATNVPRRSYRVAASSSLEIEYKRPREYKTGSVFAWSSTYATLTGGSFTELDVEIDYQKGG